MDEKVFAGRLVELRLRKGVSAREMSLAIGQNPSYINSIENGKAKPSLDGIFYICDYLGITPSEFFDLDSKNPTKLNAIINLQVMLNWRIVACIACAWLAWLIIVVA